jgi:multiple sugar transport system ATP-binding protein
MDEPLSNLDAKLRVQMRAQLALLHDRLQTTTVYVTHDQVEAMTLGERVAVLRDGILQQVDTPQNLYNHPTNLFVAAFIGSPPMNLVEAAVEGRKLSFGGFTMPVGDGADLAKYDGRTVILGIRPSDLEDREVWRNDELPTIEVRADVTEELGSEVNVIFTIDAPPVQTEETLAASSDEGEDLLRLEDRAQFCARVDARCREARRAGDALRRSVAVPLLRPGDGKRDRVAGAGGRPGLIRPSARSRRPGPPRSRGASTPPSSPRRARCARAPSRRRPPRARSSS